MHKVSVSTYKVYVFVVIIACPRILISLTLCDVSISRKGREKDLDEEKGDIKK